jgi:hypothetical protein
MLQAQDLDARRIGCLPKSGGTLGGLQHEMAKVRIVTNDRLTANPPYVVTDNRTSDYAIRLGTMGAVLPVSCAVCARLPCLGYVERWQVVFHFQFIPQRLAAKAGIGTGVGKV